VNLHRRIATLEKSLISEPTLLVMPDGSTATIPGHCTYLVNLYWSAVSGVGISPKQAAELDLIRKSTNAVEPGGSRIVEMIRCFLLGPAEEGAGV